MSPKVVKLMIVVDHGWVAASHLVGSSADMTVLE